MPVKDAEKLLAADYGGEQKMKGSERGRIVLYDISNMSREEWLKLRRTGIGGSDAAIIAGLSKYGSELELWNDKRGVGVEKEPTEAMRIGTELEDYVARRWMEETGKKCIRRKKMFGNINYLFSLANIDREVKGENAGLECKTINPFADYDFEEADIPPWYYAQCVHYMAVCGFDRMYLAVLVLGRGFYHYVIKRDQDEIDSLMEAENQWWETHIIKGVMPSPDGSESAARALKAIYPEWRKEEVPLFTSDADMDEYSRLGDEIKKLKLRQEECKQKVIAALAGAEIGKSHKYKVVYGAQTRVSLDSKKLKEELPRVYAQYATEKTSRVFKIKAI